MTILIDVNLSPNWVEYLHLYGITAVHWSTLGESNAPDSHLMTYAIDRGWTVLTQDLDFSMHLALGQMPRPSVILLRTQYSGTEHMGQQVLDILAEKTMELSHGALITISDERAKIRLLPL